MAQTILTTRLELLKALALNPEPLMTSSIVYDPSGAITSATVTWPDGTSGGYVGTPSSAWPGSTDSYSLTYLGADTTYTFTQAAVTRNTNGDVVTRPALTVA